MARKYTPRKQTRSKSYTSYDSYLNNRRKWEEKGYSLKAPMSKFDYEKTFELAKDAGLKNISYQLAADDRNYTLAQQRRFKKFLKEIGTSEGGSGGGINPFGDIGDLKGSNIKPQLFYAWVAENFGHEAVEAIY